MDKIVAELTKSPLDKQVISLREYQRHPSVDLRLDFLGDDAQGHPTRRGVTSSPSQWGDFLAAIGLVQAKLLTDPVLSKGVRVINR